jgi:hypothetical protein
MSENDVESAALVKANVTVTTLKRRAASQRWWRKYYPLHKDEILARSRRHYRSHRDERQAQIRRWRGASCALLPGEPVPHTRVEPRLRRVAQAATHSIRAALHWPMIASLTTPKRRAAKRRWKAAHPKEIAALNARYYQANRDRILESKRAHYAAHREEQKEKRRARYEAKAQRRRRRMRRESYLFRHPEAIVWYDAEGRRRERYLLHNTTEWQDAQRRRKERYLRQLECKLRLNQAA